MIARTCFVAILLAIASLPAVASDTLGSDLSALFKGKRLTLRVPDAATEIVFDAQGVRVGTPEPGPWYENVLVDCSGATANGEQLTIDGERLTFSYSFKERKLVAFRNDRHVVVKIKLAPTANNEQVGQALKKVFLSQSESLADVAPEYWEICLRGEVTNGICAWPGHTPEERFKARSATDTLSGITPPAVRAGGKPTRPVAVHSPAPEYTKIAKKAKYQGTTVLSLVVDIDGKPKNIRIIRLLGFGLEDKAAEAVRQWTFKPATKNGQPVPAQIAVEVEFHLY